MDLYLRSVFVKEFPSSDTNQARLRRFAKYLQNRQEEVVLLDPKDYGADPNDPCGEKIYGRVQDLARMLHGIEPERFRTLHCMGWFEDVEKSQFYFVYKLPPDIEEPREFTTLYQFMSERSNNYFKPSVTARIRLAHSLALSLLQLHQMGWLHKGIRSDQVVFFSRRPGASRSLDDPRLLGFDFARRDGPHEYSEKPIDKYTNLYRHPDALRDPDTNFQKVHDYYGLGVVLAEIAVWRPIEKILRRHQELRAEECREGDARRIRDILLDEHSQENHPADIRFRMGEIYYRVVEICLRGNFGAPADDIELLAVFARRIVDELGRCVI